MVRPKLVEEGKPIPQNMSDEDHHQHIAILDDEYNKATSAAGRDHNHENGRTNNSTNRSSLLQHQNSNASSKSDYKLKTSFVIGSRPQPAQHQHEHSLKSHLLKNNKDHNYKLQTTFAIGGGGQNIPCSMNEAEYSFETSNQDYEIDNIYHHRSDGSMDVDEHDHGYETNHNNDCDNRQFYEDQTYIPSFTPTRMDIDDSLAKCPLVVIDGPNVAYAYSQALSDKSSLSISSTTNQNTIEPNVRGIQIASDYFMNAGCRVQIVIPTYWLRRKPRDGNNSSDNALMMTDQIEILQQLQSQNLLLCSPPTDDDDAYAIAIARREDSRSQMRQISNVQSLSSNLSTSVDVMSISGAFILSNDLYRDAMQRDVSGNLRTWLVHGSQSDSLGGKLPGRISYSFCDVGCMDLDFVANPR